MSREIKFRAWDKKRKRMWDDVHLFQSFNDLNGKSDYCGFDRILKDDRFIPMQFTGLHDRNGKEIYEGDVVKLYRRDLFKVVWYEGAFMTAWPDGGISSNLRNFTLINECEVIGNAYENPELLNC